MIQQTFNDIYSDELAAGAIINDRHTGHKEDYLILHCLLRKHKPKTFFEVGTNTGYGTLIIKNALGNGSIVYSLDLPAEQAHLTKQHPISEGKGDCVGCECTLPYYQLFGDSRTFDYAKEPCEGYFIDGEHKLENVQHETEQIMMKCYPEIVIWHDTDEAEVMNGIIGAFDRNQLLLEAYQLYRVIGTRVTYALKKENNGTA